MTFYLFTAVCYLLLFVLMCNTLCGQTLVNAQGPSVAKDLFELFHENTIKNAKQSNEELGDASEVTVKEYYSPVFVSTKEFVFALAGVERTEELATQKRYIDILTKYTKNGDVLTANGWTPQFAVQHEVEVKSSTIYFGKGLLAVTKGNEIYLLFLNSTKRTPKPSLDLEWEFTFTVATMNKGPTKQLVWSEESINAESVIGELKKKFTKKEDTGFSFSGSAFLTEKGKIVFALVLDDSEKKISVLMQLKEKPETNFETEFVFTEILGDCYPYVFPWKEKIIMILGKCREATGKKIMELTNESKEWNDSSEAFFRQWEFLEDKKHFTTTKISGEPVLLFTEERTKTNGEQDKDVNLWMSDGNRTTKVDVITTIKSTETFTASILRTDKGLFALYQKCETEEPGSTEINKICFTNLKKHFQKITGIVNAWKQINDEIKEFYKNIDTENSLFSADGLVGFLSGTDGKDKWKDRCLNVDATFYENSKKTADNGFKFTGQGAGAQWIVGEQKEDQPYNLKYSGFTLVATVTVGSVAIGSDNSVFGVVLADNPKNGIGLWCTTGGKWVVKKKDGGAIAQSSAVECKHGERYYVALILNNNGDMISVYVNGQKLSMLKTEELKVGPSENIKHFYFGVDKEEAANTDVTIENVLLYNLPFEEKINKLIPEKNVADAQQTTQTESDQTPKSDKSTTQTDKPASTSAIKDEEEETQPSSPPPTTEDSAARVGGVGVLCFMLFGVFTLLGRYVY